jgi:hypothetical protein
MAVIEKENNKTKSFKPGDKFIREIGERQLDEFEIAGTDYYIKISLLKMLKRYRDFKQKEKDMINKDMVKLAAPWTIYANKVEAMFKEDKDIKFEYDDDKKVITLRVNENDKAEALAELLPAQKNFGNVTLEIRVIPANEVGQKSMDLFRKAFKGNPAVSQITSVDTLWGTLGFVVFKPKVIQYYNDAMFDLNGVKSTIYEDLARDLFGENGGIYYCTEKIED